MSGPLEFPDALAISAWAIAELGLVCALGFAFARLGWLEEKAIDGLTRLLIDGIVPCTLVLAAAKGLGEDEAADALRIGVASLTWILGTGLLLSGLYRLWPRPEGREADRAAVAVAMLQNGIYLPLPVALAVTAPDDHDRVFIFVAAAVFPAMVVQWTACVRLLSGTGTARQGLKGWLNAPVIGLLVGFGLSLVPGVSAAARGAPDAFAPLAVVFGAFGFLAKALAPLATILLGAFLASTRFAGRLALRNVVPAAALRLVVVPGIVFAMLRLGWIALPPVAALVLVLEAASPPAVNHALIARRFGGPWEVVSSLQLVTYAIALVTVPLWLALALGGTPG